MSVKVTWKDKQHNETNIRKLVSIGVLMIAFGAVSTAFGQQITGGYGDADVNDKTLKPLPRVRSQTTRQR
ncbi:MAG: hypothetical protein IPJ30_19785 [Acidobacteria bacterium]|nr:hypothetical protein [Acidobacteriota bacterium]